MLAVLAAALIGAGLILHRTRYLDPVPWCVYGRPSNVERLNSL
jgi:hypothetical protein